MNGPDDSGAVPIAFVHLSDLHFRESGSPLAARETALRDLLLDEIPETVARAKCNVEAILLTGDIARSGQSAEYREARAWLDELCGRLGIHPTKTQTVPGNHDINWKSFDLEPGRRAANNDLRSCPEHLIDSRIDELLLNPEFVLSPIANYQEFAAGYSCEVEKCLAWDLPPLSLGRGYSLAIRGASSVINSDWDDAKRTMAVHMNQLQVNRQPGLVRLLLIHHSPEFWRRANPTPAQCRHNIVLYGHTHEAKYQLDGANCLEITAGAIHPEEREEFAVPGYNVIDISVDEPSGDASGNVAFARVRTFHRDFSRDEQTFIDVGGFPTLDVLVEIQRASAAPSFGGLTRGTADHTAPEEGQTTDVPDDASTAETQPPLEAADGSPDPSRVVRAAYEALGAGDRLRVLDRIAIPRSEITRLPPYRQIGEVARIVVESGSLDAFLAAVSEIRT